MCGCSACWPAIGDRRLTFCVLFVTEEWRWSGASCLKPGATAPPSPLRPPSPRRPPSSGRGPLERQPRQERPGVQTSRSVYFRTETRPPNPLPAYKYNAR